MSDSPKTHTHTHPNHFTVEFKDGAFNSFLRANRSFKPGEEIASLTGLTEGPKTFATFQWGTNCETDHLDYNSDLVYMNHSCDPSTEMDVKSPNRADWRVTARKDIKAGETLTFFYPSTEWAMEQPFQCQCGSSNCLGLIRGSSKLSRAEIEKRGNWVNPWIEALLAARNAEGSRIQLLEL